MWSIFGCPVPGTCDQYTTPCNVYLKVETLGTFISIMREIAPGPCLLRLFLLWNFFPIFYRCTFYAFIYHFFPAERLKFYFLPTSWCDSLEFSIFLREPSIGEKETVSFCWGSPRTSFRSVYVNRLPKTFRSEPAQLSSYRPST